MISRPHFVEKVWGKEEVVVNNKHYCGKLLHLSPNAQSSLHMHKTKHETFYVLDGFLWFQLGQEMQILKPRDIVVVKPNTYHRFKGISKSIIVEFSTPHSDKDVYRKEKSCVL